MMDDKEKALVDILKDLYSQECKKSTKYLIINYVLVALLFICVIIASMLAYELSTYDEVIITETTTSASTSEVVNNSVEGDNASIINGNQYNDSAKHNEN